MARSLRGRRLGPLALALAMCCINAAAVERFNFWVDYPGSAAAKKNNPQWYDVIEVRNGSSFETDGGVTVGVDWENHRGLHLYSNPAFMQHYDDLVRERNGKEASTMSGTLDDCGWPGLTPTQAPKHAQWTRQTTPFFDDFRNGLDPANFLVATGEKGCCDPVITKNVNIGTDVVNGKTKNVLELTAWNGDVKYPNQPVRKKVNNAGMVKTAGHFASGRYEVDAKVPAASGVVWAVWTYHYEEHFPAMCDRYTCMCGNGGKVGCPDGKCMPKSQYKAAGCPFHGPDYTEPCLNNTLCDQYWDTDTAGECGAQHLKVGPDPQFLGSNSFSGYTTQLNHEIDIEIPANCEKTTVCDPSCEGDYSTANFNNYLYTNNGGEGPAYANMCVKATKDKVPLKLIGDNKYHTYRFDWHTGTAGNATSSHVDFYVDNIYMGTNNAFVPTRASRFALALWGAAWNGDPNDWHGGHPGDGKSYSQTAKVSAVRITPFNEPNDLIYMSVDDQPRGCVVPIIGNKVCHEFTNKTIPPVIHPTSDDDPFDDDAPPPPPPSNDDDEPQDCTASKGRGLGCPCRHSQECASDWCSGKPSTCHTHPKL